MSAIPDGYRLTLSDEQGVVLDVIELGGYDLSKSLARGDLVDSIVEEIESDQRRKTRES